MESEAEKADTSGTECPKGCKGRLESQDCFHRPVGHDEKFVIHKGKSPSIMVKELLKTDVFNPKQLQEIKDAVAEYKPEKKRRERNGRICGGAPKISRMFNFIKPLPPKRNVDANGELERAASCDILNVRKRKYHTEKLMANQIFQEKMQIWRSSSFYIEKSKLAPKRRTVLKSTLGNHEELHSSSNSHQDRGDFDCFEYFEDLSNGIINMIESKIEQFGTNQQTAKILNSTLALPKEP